MSYLTCVPSIWPFLCSVFSFVLWMYSSSLTEMWKTRMFGANRCDMLNARWTTSLLQREQCHLAADDCLSRGRRESRGDLLLERWGGCEAIHFIPIPQSTVHKEEHQLRTKPCPYSTICLFAILFDRAQHPHEPPRSNGVILAATGPFTFEGEQWGIGRVVLNLKIHDQLQISRQNDLCFSTSHPSTSLSKFIGNPMQSTFWRSCQEHYLRCDVAQWPMGRFRRSFVWLQCHAWHWLVETICQVTWLVPSDFGEPKVNMRRRMSTSYGSLGISLKRKMRNNALNIF